jgi:uncharacterized membrane protein
MRLVEMLLGLPRGFLAREGELSVRFNPVWPWQDVVGAGVWNAVILVGMVWLVVWVYRRDGRSTFARWTLGGLRLALMGLVLLLLNRPVITLTQNRVEPSVLAVLLDDSLSMKVRDVAAAQASSPTAGDTERLQAAITSLLGETGLLAEFGKTHTVRLYRFGSRPEVIPLAEAASTLPTLQPVSGSTAVGPSVATVAGELAGQRLAGVVVLTDGRDSPARAADDSIARLRELGTRVYAVEVGTDRAPRNLSVGNVVLQDSAFRGDLVSVRVSVRGTGYPPGQRVRVRVVDVKTGVALPGVQGPAEAEVVLGEDGAAETDVPIKPDAVGELELAAIVSAVGESATGEVDDLDNSRSARLAVLDTQVNLLYIEGYPRWDYRFLRTELIRDSTVDVSILLTSADEGFAQDGDKPIRRFPETMEELLAFDAVLIGDVDPRQFTDAQLQLLAEFVGKKGGGLAMVAGTRYSPFAYRNSPLEAVLPVALARAEPESTTGDLQTAFRIAVTPAGLASGVFRFLPDPDANAKYLRDDWQMVFWYLRGVTVKPGAGEVLAEHPSEFAPDGKKAPILVAGRYGAGRTLFSAIDDSWRFRYYTGESVFDTYWVQQIRLLARGRKLGQRLFTVQANRSVYELGQQVNVTLRVLEGNLLRQMPDRVDAEVIASDGSIIRRKVLTRTTEGGDSYAGQWKADTLGRFTLRVPYIAPGAGEGSTSLEVISPRLELTDARLDRTALQRLTAETGGQSISLADSAQLPERIPSAAKIIPMESSRPLWDAPIAMALFVLLLTAEWVARKIWGMV